jgi:hypothetical protein
MIGFFPFIQVNIDLTRKTVLITIRGLICIWKIKQYINLYFIETRFEMKMTFNSHFIECTRQWYRHFHIPI